MSVNTDETYELAMRFLRVLEALGKLTKYRPPDDVAESLHLNQVRALHRLKREPGIAQKHLAEYLGVSPAAVSTSVRQMEHLDLVERRPDPDDTRVLRLYLSERGRHMFDEMQQERCDAVMTLLEVLPLTEQRAIVDALERALEANRDELAMSV